MTNLTHLEKTILSKLTIAQLKFLADIAENKEFAVFPKIVNTMIDYEKDYFFGEKEFNKDKLAVDHAFARGGIAKMVEFTRILGAARGEMGRREEEREKRNG